MAEPAPNFAVNPSGAATPLGLPRRLRAQLYAWAHEGHPHETCGLLVGSHGATDTTVARITRARNLAGERRADRYTLDPDHFLAVDTLARADGLEIVGIWHSHPDHPEQPSATDRAAAWETFTYLILSVTRHGVVAARAWRLEDGAFAEQPIAEESR